MALDLKKVETEERIYYYSDNGNAIGPFSLSGLLEKIGPETLVYREGIDWTNAKEVQELKKFFKVEKVVSDPISSFLTQDAVISPNPASLVAGHQKMFSAPFSFKGRIRRMEYGLSSIIFSISYGIVMAMVDSFSFVAFAIIPIIWFFLAQGAKRCHDRGNSGWYLLIPYYALWLLFGDSDPGSNKYGNSPKN